MNIWIKAAKMSKLGGTILATLGIGDHFGTQRDEFRCLSVANYKFAPPVPQTSVKVLDGNTYLLYRKPVIVKGASL